MRNISKLALSMTLLATQVNVPQFDFGNVAAAASALAPAAGVYEVKLNTNTASVVEIVAQKKPNFDTEVLAPLRAAQAEALAKAQAEAQKRIDQAKAATKRAAAVIIPTGDVWNSLRLCEAGGDYARNSGNGYYGAYQYNLGTWANYMGYARPDLAPAEVQDAKAHQTQSARGWSPWPACARKLGLM